MDSQTIEILGRNRLVDELLVAGLEVATLLRDRGIDLIAYVDLAADASKFAAVPISMKAASERAPNDPCVPSIGVGLGVACLFPAGGASLALVVVARTLSARITR